MTAGTVFWLAVAVASAILFFGIAAVVSIYGLKDLRRLLGGTDEAKKQSDVQSPRSGPSYDPNRRAENHLGH
jgi:hypothetical protein